MPHIHEKIDFTVEVFVINKNKVLLRLHDKYKIWLSVGGHIELDEDPNQAAIREVKEEVGLDVKLADDLLNKSLDHDDFRELIPPKSINRHHINEVHEHVSMIYFATSKDDNVKPEKNSDVWKWLTKEEVERMPDLRPDIRFYALKALEQLAEK